MSTIKVNKIENTSTTDGGISIDNSGHVTVDGQQLPSTGPLSNRNLVMNGAMRVAQRATSKTSITTLSYVCDRWLFAPNSLGTWTITQENDAPNGFKKSFKATCTTADASPAAGDYCLIVHRFEGQNLQHLKFGTSDAESLILSFWVKSNKTGNASFGNLQTDNSSKQFTASYTINTANTWEYKTIQIPADTAGVINNDNGVAFTLDFWLNSGSNYTGGSHSAGWETAANTNRNSSNLGVGGAVNDYFQITGVQLEVGSVATPFEHRSFADELFSCQRYYQEIVAGRVNASYFGHCDSDGRVVVVFPLARELRSNIAHDGTGTVTRTGVVRVKDGFPSSAANNNDAIDYYNNISNSLMMGLSTTASGVTAGNSYMIRIGSAGDQAVFTIDNEL